MNKITRAQAVASLESVKKQFNAYIQAGYAPPVLMEDFDGKDFVLVWEEGPYEWTYLCPQGGHDEELSAEAGMAMSWDPAPDWPEGVWAEPVNHYSLALYPEDA